MAEEHTIQDIVDEGTAQQEALQKVLWIRPPVKIGHPTTALTVAQPGWTISWEQDSALDDYAVHHDIVVYLRDLTPGTGETVVSTIAIERDGYLLSEGRYNLLAPAFIPSLASALAGVNWMIDPDSWPGWGLYFFEVMASDVQSAALATYRATLKPPVQSYLELQADTSSEPVYAPFFFNGRSTIVFGTGGSGKSYWTLWVACQVAAAGHKVLWCDYEEGPDEWASRVGGVQDGFAAQGNHLAIDGNNLLYRRMVTPLAQDTELERYVIANGVSLLVVDSAAPASGKAQDDQAVAEVFTYLARLGCSSSIIAHVTKQDNSPYPFGSVFWHNLARNIFRVDSEKRVDGQGLSISLTDTKHNRVETASYDLTFNGDYELAVTPGSATDSAIARVGVGKRILDLLQHGSMSRDMIKANLTDRDPDLHDSAIRQAFSRLSRERKLVVIGDGYGLPV